MTEQLVAVAGRGVVDAGTLVVDADDLGLTRGDGVFDATRVVTSSDGIAVVEHLEEHLARLNNSVVGLGDQPSDLDVWRDLVAQALDAWRVPGEAILKLMYTRGGESTPASPVLLLTITQATDAMLAQRQGITVALLSRGMASDAFADAPWLLGGVKTLSYAVNKASLREAARRGCDDVLFVSSDGYLLEGPSSSLLVMLDDALVTTPTGATGILDSITQKTCFAAAQADGVPTEYRLLRPSDLERAQGVWLLSSIRGAAPVTAVDGTALPHDAQLSARVARWCGF